MKDHVNVTPKELTDKQHNEYVEKCLGALCVIGLLFLTFIIGCL